jgi:hypothetical protein
MSIVGRYNSSITRVRPFFQYLINEDITGQSWLSALLSLFPNIKIVFPDHQNIGALLHELTTKAEFSDKILKRHGINNIQLEHCFEYSLPPTKRFLSWLIQHPNSLHPPAHLSNDKEKRKYRENLLGRNGLELQQVACQTALHELDKNGPLGSGKQWWAFEGFTEVDCYLEIPEFILLIEGKRTENLSQSVSWYPHRNQLIRNLEAAQALADEKGKHYAVGVMSEKSESFPTDQEVDESLPHFAKEERKELLRHYIGNVLWKDACKGLDIPMDILPETIEEVLKAFEKQKRSSDSSI